MKAILLNSFTVTFGTAQFSRLLALFSSAVILGSLFSFAPQAVLASDNAANTKEEPTKIAITNFGFVSESIWRGGVPSDVGLHQLADNGVRTIVDLRMNGSSCKKEELMAHKLGLKYIRLPMGFKSPSCSRMTEFLKIVSNPLNLPVYVHCHQGADRTGVLVGVYRIIVENWTFEHAYKEMRSHHFKPWLFNMKKTVIAATKDGSIRKNLQTAVDNGNVHIIDSSDITSLNHSG